MSHDYSQNHYGSSDTNEIERLQAELAATNNLVTTYFTEIERLNALAGPSGKSLHELEQINDDLCAKYEALEEELAVARSWRDTFELGFDAQKIELSMLKDELATLSKSQPAQVPKLLKILVDLVQLEADCLTESENAIDYWERARAVIAECSAQPAQEPPTNMIEAFHKTYPQHEWGTTPENFRNCWHNAWCLGRDALPQTAEVDRDAALMLAYRALRWSRVELEKYAKLLEEGPYSDFDLDDAISKVYDAMQKGEGQ